MKQLSQEARISTAWEEIRGILEERLERHRQKNDAEDTPEKTARLRGRIAEIKDILALGEEPKPKEFGA